jgi:hypothetical protein
VPPRVLHTPETDVSHHQILKKSPLIMGGACVLLVLH